LDFSVVAFHFKSRGQLLL